MPPAETLHPALAAVAQDPGCAGVLTDFDGTLAPIVEDPAAAVALPGAVDALHHLAGRYRRVAVVSGRPVSFLVAQLRMGDGRAGEPPLAASAESGGPGHDEAPGLAWLRRRRGLVAVGLYGLEMADGERVACHPGVDRWRGVVAEVAQRAAHDAPPGVIVERKGLSVTLHYRTAPAAGPWCKRWARKEAARTSLALHPARMSEELRPPLPVDKGTVVAELAAGLEAVCFLGDDRGDLPAFDALEEMAARAGVLVAKVAVRSPEAPPDLLARADVVVDGPEGALAILRALSEAPG